MYNNKIIKKCIYICRLASLVSEMTGDRESVTDCDPAVLKSHVDYASSMVLEGDTQDKG